MQENCSVVLERSAENEEMYLKAVWLLEEQGKKPVHSAAIARMLGISLPSVVEMLGKLHKKNLVTYDGRRGVSFKAKGRKIAGRVVRNLRLTELLFRDVLKIDYNSPEPCRFEHAISDEIAAAMLRVLGNPKECPHGKPIPKL
jgi:DtxR family Mn-dependent transcriptional regulator